MADYVTALLTVRDVADMLQVSRSTVLRWTATGDLPGIRLPSGQLRYLRTAIDRWLDERATGSGGQTLSAVVGLDDVAGQ